VRAPIKRQKDVMPIYPTPFFLYFVR